MEKLEEHSETGSAVGHSATSESSASASQQDTPSAPPPPTVPSFWEAYRLLAQSYQAERATLMQCSPRTTAGPSASPLHLPLPRDDVPSLTLTPSYRNLFAMEADGGTSERLAPAAFSSMSRRDSRNSRTSTLTAKAAEEAVARACGHRLQHVLSTADTTASHCVEMKYLPQDMDEPSFGTRPCWEPDLTFSPLAPRQRTSITITQPRTSSDEKRLRWLSGRIILPNGRRRACWDALAVGCLLLELVYMPLTVFAADWPCAKPTAVEIFLHAFWHLDILMTFVTGIYCRGELVLSPRRIAQNYVRGWLAFDVLYVTVNWLSLLGGRGSRCSRYSSMLVRFCQLALRLLRMCRLSQMTESMKGRLSSETLMAESNILQITGQILLVHHLLACVWYVVGQIDESKGWVAVYLNEPSVAYSYTTSLYWMFCQLGFGGTNIEPVTTLERSFALMVAFMALGIFSTLLGIISATVLNLNKSTEEKRVHFRQLKQFLCHHRISDELSQRICRFLEHAWALKNEVVLESSVELLELLSTPLRRELRCARYEHCLGELGFHGGLTQKLSLQLRSKTYAAADTVFEAGGVAEQAYFLSEGSLTYSWAERKVTFDEKDRFGWIAEMCLWTPWVHVGELSTRRVSCVEIIQIEPFFDCICRSLDVLQLARSYAEEFVATMNSFAAVTDLWHPEPEVEREESLRVGKVSKRGGLFASQRPVDFSSVVPLP